MYITPKCILWMYIMDCETNFDLVFCSVQWFSNEGAGQSAIHGTAAELRLDLILLPLKIKREALLSAARLKLRETGIETGKGNATGYR